MKKILLTLYKDRSHSLYKQFIHNSPEGYQYFTLDNFFNEFIFDQTDNLFTGIIAKIKRNQKIIRVAKENNIDIIYCCDGMLLFNSPIPWVMECENTISLIANSYGLWKIGKKIIPIFLKQKNLKFIIPWTEAAKLTLECNLKINEEIRSKIVPIHLCRKEIGDYASIENKRIRNKIFSILFVTSINYNGENEFYAKGGRMLVRVFKELKKKIKLKLILRSKIPAEFNDLKNDPDVEIYEGSLLDEDFEMLFLKADIFFFPGYQSPGMAFLDAMNYNLSIISTNVFSNPEMVKAGWNGFLVDFPESNIAFYLRDEFDIKGIPSGVRAREDIINEKMINEFVEKIIKLQQDDELLKKMGENSKRLIMEEFSLKKRNEKLKNIFDKIIREQ